MIKSLRLFIVLFVFTNICTAQNIGTLKILKDSNVDIQKTWLLKKLTTQFDHRRAEVQIASQSAEKLLARRDSMRKWFVDIVGELPPKTPLNSKFGDKTDMGAYTIEPVFFESQPNHHVTGLFYTPTTGKPPYPAVYIPCGHTFNGKEAEFYRGAAMMFALNGFVVLQADPICQGERQQHLDEAGNPLFNSGGTSQHEVLGQSLMLTGSNTLIHELFDNIRCIDFLVQQAVVDKDKIAVTGNSGGGTQTTYLAAYDRRIKVAVPSCYIATTEKKLNTVGSQDGCQQLWGEGKAGIEEQDFLFMAAPIPILISSAKQDFFPLDGAVSAFNELKGLYTILGSPEKINQYIYDAAHGWHKPMREASVRWCKKWLLNDSSLVPLSEIAGNLTPMLATPTGQVLTSFSEEKSVTDISIERMEKARITRDAFQKSLSKTQMKAKIKAVIGFEEPPQKINSEKKGSIQGKGFKIEKLLIERDEQLHFFMPALLFVPENTKRKSSAVIIVSEQGKDSLLTPESQIMKEIEKGNIVLAIDVSNTGELKDGRNPRCNNKEFWMGKLALYEGKTLMTYRAEELIIAKRYLQSLPMVNKREISIYSTGLTGPAVLHAAYFDQGFRQVTIVGSLNTWEDVASASLSKDQIANIVPNVLNYYDLPDLVRWTPRSKIEIISPVAAMDELK